MYVIDCTGPVKVVYKRNPSQEIRRQESNSPSRGFSALTVRVALVHPDSDPRLPSVTLIHQEKLMICPRSHNWYEGPDTAALRWEPKVYPIPKSAI